MHEPKSLGVRLAAGCAYLAIAVQLAGMAVAAYFYNHGGPDGYAVWNHFISELGWPERSPMAWVSNTGVSVGSLLFGPLLFVLARRMGTGLGWTAFGFGAAAMLGGFGCGLIPIAKNLTPHLATAYLYFLAWLVAVTLFSLALWRRPINGMSRAVAGMGAVCAAVTLLFLYLTQGTAGEALRILHGQARPAVWWLALSEWGVVLTFYAWNALAAAGVWMGAEPFTEKITMKNGDAIW